MFSKVLIANRGEIAVRVLQTLQAMSIASVAVYSDADAHSPHVALADEGYPLGGVSAEETYLDQGKLIGLALQAGADAVHPGYGFLSENPSFAKACVDAGLAFIGPAADTIALFGDKVRSKDLAIQAGAPVVPSSPLWQPPALIQEQAHLNAFVHRWGFPLLVKAAAGGGGRGMRLVEQPEDLQPALESASREAAASFADGRVFLERFFPGARHVEFQVLADTAGKTIHLLERECSVQRRYQKVIEETPSLALGDGALGDGLRNSMGRSAVALAVTAGYTNAGTVEFLVDPETGEYYFLEMNARIQVEHPITEETLRLDLVEWQLRIACDEPITLSQQDIRPSGHAIECRICAEDPYNDFAPATGQLLTWQPPHGVGLRLDSGVAEGLEVTPYYDSMLAKLVSWAPDRPACIERMLRALQSFPAIGVTTNLPFLIRAIDHPAFRLGDYDTGFVQKYSGLTAPSLIQALNGPAMALADHFWQLATPTNTGRAGAAPVRLNGPWQTIQRANFP